MFKVFHLFRQHGHWISGTAPVRTSGFYLQFFIYTRQACSFKSHLHEKSETTQYCNVLYEIKKKIGKWHRLQRSLTSSRILYVALYVELRYIIWGKCIASSSVQRTCNGKIIFFCLSHFPLELAKFRYHEKLYLFKHSYMACTDRVQAQYMACTDRVQAQ